MKNKKFNLMNGYIGNFVCIQHLENINSFQSNIKYCTGNHFAICTHTTRCIPSTFKMRFKMEHLQKLSYNGSKQICPNFVE